MFHGVLEVPVTYYILKNVSWGPKSACHLLYFEHAARGPKSACHLQYFEYVS